MRKNCLGAHAQMKKHLHSLIASIVRNNFNLEDNVHPFDLHVFRKSRHLNDLDDTIVLTELFQKKSDKQHHDMKILDVNNVDNEPIYDFFVAGDDVSVYLISFFLKKK